MTGMAVRTLTHMSQLGSLPRKRLIDSLKLSMPATILVAIAFGFLRHSNQTLLPAALDFATSAAVGVTAGLTTRWTLKGRAGLLHMLAAIAVTISGLIILGLVTWQQAGIKMLITRSEADWNALGQVIVGACSAWFALRAWRSSVQITSPAPASPEHFSGRLAPPPRVTRPRRSRRGSARSAAAGGLAAVPTHWLASLSGVARSIELPRWRAPHITLPHWRMPQVELRNPFRGRDSVIKVNGVTEERCPYCLDVIAKHDPRGVHVCPICHTPHHADCWAMTGMCQIPHYHN